MTAHSRTTILAALKSLLEGIAAIGEVYDYPLTSDTIPADAYPAVDLQWVGGGIGYTVSSVAEFDERLNVRIYARTRADLDTITYAIHDALVDAFTLSGTCLEALPISADPPRVMGDAPYIADLTLRIRYRRSY